MEPKTAYTGAGEVPPAFDRQAQFSALTQALRDHGVYAGTGHKRITIPKGKLTEDDLRGLGFESVLMAVPEAGQDRFRSFRHPDNLFHLHSHPGRWTMHEDEHPSSTMLSRKVGPVRATAQGAPHVITEGLPGLAYYLGGQLRGRGSTANVVQQQLSPEVRAMIDQLPDSPHAKAAADHVETRRQKERRGFHTVKAPGFLDTRGAFEDAARRNAETKLAAAREAARADALAKFALLRRKGGGDDPVAELTQHLHRQDDRLRGVPAPAPRPGKNQGVVTWGSPASLDAGDAASRSPSFNPYSSYGGV